MQAFFFVELQLVSKCFHLIWHTSPHKANTQSNWEIAYYNHIIWPTSHTILKFVSKRDIKQSCDVTNALVLECVHCSGRQTMSTIEFVTWQHCLASFWRQTNIKISWDLATRLHTNLKISWYQGVGCMMCPLNVWICLMLWLCCMPLLTNHLQQSLMAWALSETFFNDSFLLFCCL